MLITVFSPTYNRAHLMPRLYDSLCKQTYLAFEWVIVDDGSKDNTEEVTERFIKEKKIRIRYFKQGNGGKHRAINRGVKEAKGELFLILDSDDTLLPNSLEMINKYYQQIKDDDSYAGVCGYMAHHDGTIIGNGNNDAILNTTSIDLRYKYNVKGDMCEVFKTSVMRLFPFPEIEKERFCPEILIWNRIATKYKIRVFHEVIYFRDYLEGGLTDKIIKIRMNSPIASMMTYAEMTKYKNVPFLEKCKSAINYWRFYLCTKQHSIKPKIATIWSLLFPVGFIMHLRDIRLTR